MADDTRERVALDLAKVIADAETLPGSGPRANPRRYWLELYAQCRVAAYGGVDAPPFT